MVKYLCEMCNTKYSNLGDAENCEKQGLIGPEIEPGLLFSHKTVEEGFMVLYGRLGSEGHERKYFMEEIMNDSPNHVYEIQKGNIKFSKLIEWLKPYKIANDDEVNLLNSKLGNEKVLGIRGLETYLKEFRAKKLHNNFDMSQLK